MEQPPTGWRQQGNPHSGPDPGLPSDKGTISLTPVRFHRLHLPQNASEMLVEPTRNGPTGASKRSCYLILVQESTFTWIILCTAKQTRVPVAQTEVGLLLIENSQLAFFQFFPHCLFWCLYKPKLGAAWLWPPHSSWAARKAPQQPARHATSPAAWLKEKAPLGGTASPRSCACSTQRCSPRLPANRLWGKPRGCSSYPALAPSYLRKGRCPENNCSLGQFSAPH